MLITLLQSHPVELMSLVVMVVIGFATFATSGK
jgi:hypothetical protein